MDVQTLTREALIEAQGTDVIDRDGEKIGAVEDVYYDEDTGRAEWIGIGTGLFGLKRRVVPVDGAQLEDGALRVPYAKDQVKDSPGVDDDEIDADAERELYAHYGVATSHGLATDVRVGAPRADGLPDSDEEAAREGEVGASPGDVGLRPPRLDPDLGESRQSADERTREELRTEEERLEQTERQARLRRWVP
jgi:hypothetical protein